MTTATPAPVRSAILLWLAAIGAGVAEALVRLAMPDPPTATQLATRFAIYAALVVLVLALHTGRNIVRWALAVLLGVVGMLSLVVEPLTWLLDGGSPLRFLLEADTAELVITGLRTAHILAVIAALVMMFRPSANEFFARSRVVSLRDQR